MKSLLARAGGGRARGGKKDLTKDNNGGASSYGSALIPDTSATSPSSSSLVGSKAPEAERELGQGEKVVYAVTTREEVPPRALPSVRARRNACVRGYYRVVDACVGVLDRSDRRDWIDRLIRSRF
jgi:hypothetical protein